VVVAPRLPPELPQQPQVKKDADGYRVNQVEHPPLRRRLTSGFEATMHLLRVAVEAVLRHVLSFEETKIGG
jgi:hypothetical protein